MESACSMTRGFLVTTLVAALAVTGAGQVTTGQVTQRVSVDSGGIEGNSLSWGPSISADGRYVAFESGANNLVSGKTNWWAVDVYVRDHQSGTTERVSVGSGGVEGDEGSGGPSISADGRYVAFSSGATNFVSGDTNWSDDVFVRDRWSSTTERVSVSSAGIQGDGDSVHSSISANGRYVAFWSTATNLVSGDTNAWHDVFVRDRWSGTTERVSVSTGGVQGNGKSETRTSSISDDGRYVAFWSTATNLVSGDTNGTYDVFVRDRSSGTTERVSVNSGGVEGDGGSIGISISADGQYVAFSSGATNLVDGDTNAWSDTFVRDRWSGTTERVSVSSNGVQGNSSSLTCSISADGRYVAFTSLATNFVSGDTNGDLDVFVRDRWSGTTERVSVSSGRVQGNDLSNFPSISADGRHVAFESDASNLVSGDTNGVSDVFVRESRLRHVRRR